jgi:hypothetical protein
MPMPDVLGQLPPVLPLERTEQSAHVLAGVPMRRTPPEMRPQPRRQRFDLRPSPPYLGRHPLAHCCPPGQKRRKYR